MWNKKKNQKIKRWLVLICSLSLIWADGLPVLASTASAASEKFTYEMYRAGEGGSSVREEEELIVIEITCEEELRQLAADCSLDSWSKDKYVKLMNDISLDGDEDLCIPSFGGIFDGNGYRITNLRISGSGSARGLFRYVQESGVVRRLTVAGQVTPGGSGNQVGGIAGVNYGSISGCSFSGNVSGDCEVGGIAGINAKTGEIKNCRSSAVVSGNHSTGGITGDNRGVLSNCTNSGAINIHSTEVSYELQDITMEKLEERSSASAVSAHTDTGGIAGISQGKIYYCVNKGDVGYSHVGYNVGGIVGRLHQGYVQNCTNTGQILGRKDVGGIVGQMEPFLEIQYLNDKLQELDRETEKFLDLLDVSQQDLSSHGGEIASLTKELTEHLENAGDAAGRLLHTTNDIWYLYNQELTGLSNDLKTLNKDLENQGTSDRDNGNVHDVTVSGGDFTVSGGDITIQVPNDKAGYEAALRKFADSTGSRLEHITEDSAERAEDIRDDLDILDEEMKAASDRLGLLADTLEEGTDNAGNNMDAMTEQARVLRRLISDIRDDLFQYEGIVVEDVSDEAPGKGTEEPGAEPESAQETESGDEAAAETDTAIQTEILYDTSSFQQGKVTLCYNGGEIEADTNVGGIVGQIAIEYDIDPEDDITLTGAESFNIEQTVKAVVRDSRNAGAVTGKKDYVGGIVGKADYGAVISCESYGEVASTQGSYVGGVAGCSGYAVRSCYSMGRISGKNYVGGIVGKGCDIFYCASYPVLETTGECRGSIAGQIQTDGTLCGNYYVQGDVGGIDDISYLGGAAPLSYEEFVRMENLPEEFLEFTVVFQAEGKELASFRCRYGEGIDRGQLPAIPEKEGYYGVWPEFDFDCITGSRVLEVQYEKWISALESETRDESGRPRFMVEGNFLPEHTLILQEEGASDAASESGAEETQTVTFAVVQAEGEEYQEAVRVRALCEEPDKMIVQVSGEDGVFREVETQVMGSYLVFPMERPGTFRLTNSTDYGILKLVISVACALAVLLVLAFVIWRMKRRGNRKVKTERRK